MTKETEATQAVSPRPPKTWTRRLKLFATRNLGEDRFLQASTVKILSQLHRHERSLLLVHTMGKVGSTSIAASLKTQPIGQDAIIFQPHFISDEGIAFAEKLAIEGDGPWETLPRKTRRGFLRNRLLNKELHRMRTDGDRCTVISLVRDPVATNLSGLFHNRNWWPASLKNPKTQGTDEWHAALATYFLDSYPHDVPAEWFDMEVKDLYGIDVYETLFDTARGYAIYHNEFADLMVLKLEMLDACAPEAFAEFLEIPDFTLARTNTASVKDYSDLYKEFRRRLVLPESYLDRVYGSKMATHFYSEEEIQKFHDKWIPKQSSTNSPSGEGR
ncbi:MAG: putative capsular polysaccharide synthesis family protein [Chloroflexota bacterium]